MEMLYRLLDNRHVHIEYSKRKYKFRPKTLNLFLPCKLTNDLPVCTNVTGTY